MATLKRNSGRLCCRAERGQLAAALLDMLTLSSQLLSEFKHPVRSSHANAVEEARQNLLTLLE
jgi:hypothetical protein